MAPGQEDLPPTPRFSHRAADPGTAPSQTEVSYLGTPPGDGQVTDIRISHKMEGAHVRSPGLRS